LVLRTGSVPAASAVLRARLPLIDSADAGAGGRYDGESGESGRGLCG
jgi:hypothetical protein